MYNFGKIYTADRFARDTGNDGGGDNTSKSGSLVLDREGALIHPHTDNVALVVQSCLIIFLQMHLWV